MQSHEKPRKQTIDFRIFLNEVEYIEKTLLTFKENFKTYPEKELGESINEIIPSLTSLVEDADILVQANVIQMEAALDIADCLHRVKKVLELMHAPKDMIYTKYVTQLPDMIWNVKYYLQILYNNIDRDTKNGKYEITTISNHSNNKDESPTLTLAALPYDMLIEILLYLNLNDRLNMRRVSKLFNTLFNDTHKVLAILMQTNVLDVIYSNLNMSEKATMRVSKKFRNKFDSKYPEINKITNRIKLLNNSEIKLARSIVNDAAEEFAVATIKYSNKKNNGEDYLRKFKASIDGVIGSNANLLAYKKDIVWSQLYKSFVHSAFTVAAGITDLGVLFSQDSESYKCIVNDSSNPTKCQNDALKTLQMTISQQVMWGLSIGLVSRTIIDYAESYVFYKLSHQHSVIPNELKPLTTSDNVKYGGFTLLKDILPYLDLSIMGFAIYFTMGIHENFNEPVDISNCDTEVLGNNMYDIDCLNAAVTNRADMPMNMTDGFLYGYAALGSMILLYQFLAGICMKARNSYQTYQQNRLFTPATTTANDTNYTSVTIEEVEEDNDTALDIMDAETTRLLR